MLKLARALGEETKSSTCSATAKVARRCQDPIAASLTANNVPG